MARKDIIMPTDAEDKEITAAALADPDNPPLDDAMLATARRGRPKLHPDDRKQRVTVMLDPDVISALKSSNAKGWQTRMNHTLREALGLEG